LSPGKLVIAIDGPAASGKSTTARLVAERLGYVHVDTGAMYRAVTLKVLRAGIPPADGQGIARLLETTHVALRREGELIRVLLDGEDVNAEIRSPEVTRAVSAVSRHRSVREMMVFPDADLKFFLIAGIEARARRRGEELRARGISPDLGGLIEEIRERDSLDSTRDESPLRKAEDAIEIDTSHLTIEEQVRVVVERVRAVGEGKGA
jgi:cytidylate kinase